MADLILPILILIIMYIIIDVFDEGIVLISIALIWIPIAFIMSSTISSGGFDKLFGATIGIAPMAIDIIGLMAFTVPLLSLVKMFYVRRVMIGEKQDKGDDDASL